jgi:ribosomal protein S18 acetylase RimI-like enzyme
MRMIQRDDYHFFQIDALNTICFTGDERAPRGVLKEQWGKGECFVEVSPESGMIVSFAIVSEKFCEKYVWAIATHPAWRGQGFAGRLLDEIEAWARETKDRSIALTTHEANPAQKLYFDKGYRVAAVLKDYYMTGNGILMRRKLL